MFLYDMLNSKHINLKNTVSQVNRTVKEAEETFSNFQKLAPEPVAAEKEHIVEKTAEPVGKKEPQRWMPDKIIGGQSERTVSSDSVAGTSVAGAVPAGTVPARVSFMQDTDEQGRNNNEKILELFKQGKSTVAIARELGLGVGEVKLVIDLFKNQ